MRVRSRRSRWHVMHARRAIDTAERTGDNRLHISSTTVIALGCAEGLFCARMQDAQPDGTSSAQEVPSRFDERQVALWLVN